MKGKFIVIYGINNIGKSTQAKKLVEYLKSKGKDAEYLKYPIYDLEPSGPFINNVLRSQKQEISEEQFQMWYTINRFQYEPELKKKLESGKWIIAEDYTGTGIAWGAAKGADMDWLKKINAPLIVEDIAFLFEGDRFQQGKEDVHVHEQNDEYMEKVKKTHDQLGREGNWIRINANQPIDKVFEDMKKEIEKVL